jgi:hypothetical protein
MTVFEQTQLASNGDFQAKIGALMVKATIAKIGSGSPATPDILLGQRILDGLEPVRPWTTAVCTQPGVADAANSVLPAGNGLTDGALETIVNSIWLAFSR